MMKNMSKIAVVLLLAVMTALCFAACKKNEPEPTHKREAS